MPLFTRRDTIALGAGALAAGSVWPLVPAIAQPPACTQGLPRATSTERRNTVYVSGLTVEDPGLLATLCLFYDRIWLPHPYDLNPDAKPLMRWDYDHLFDLEIHQKAYMRWLYEHRELFSACVLEVLPPPLELGGNEPVDLDEQLRDELGIQVPFFGSSDALSGRIAIAMHALFSQTRDPEFVLSHPGDTSTEHLRAVLASSLMERRLPKLRELRPEQILELREEVAPYKEGFVDYLSGWVDDVEKRLDAAKWDEREAVLHTLERKIEPDLDEYLRRRFPEKVKWWSKLIGHVASTVGALVKIVVTPWDLANYPDLVSGPAGVAEVWSEAAVEKASNKHLAFQYIGTIETETQSVR